MKKVKFRCERCKKEFVIEVFEPGEAEATRRPSAQVRCPECRGPVKRA